MLFRTLLMLLLFTLVACEQSGNTPSSNATSSPIDRQAVVTHYADMAHAIYSDSLQSVIVLREKVEALIQNPSAATHQDAKNAWLVARQVYGQSEAFRFGNPNVDEWEGQVNAWPLDEGLIDYVNQNNYDFTEANQFAQANIIASNEDISDSLLRAYHERGGSEANVASGYHAIEFLLWGQDLNQSPTDKGRRPWTDFSNTPDCTGGNCDRRAQYLRAATVVLLTDLKRMSEDWSPEFENNYRTELLSASTDEGLRRMVFGIGSLSLGELSGERMNVALLAHSQEDEHSCFSDNTHNDIDQNIQGINNVYHGSYLNLAGEITQGPSLHDLLLETDPVLAERLANSLADTKAKSEVLVSTAEAGEHFDQQIINGNTTGNARIKAIINALRTQTEFIEDLSQALSLPNI